MDSKDVARIVAMEVLKLPTLRSRKMDSLDFHELSVWQIEKALIDAYERGLREGLENAKEPD